MTQLSSSNPKARTDHKCNWCSQVIPKGELYERSGQVYDGRLYTWKNHFHCRELARKLKMWDNCDEGVTEEDFWEYTNEEYRVLMDKHHNVPYDSRAKLPPFKEQMLLVLNHHQIPHTIAA